MAYSFFPMIARMRYINRWGLMRNTQTENIQEHSHMVAVLAHALAVIENEKFGGQVDPGQVAVAAVVLNRVRSASFPNTVSGVVYQQNAFTCVNNGSINNTPDSSCIRAALDALNGWDPTGGCLYYYNPKTAVDGWIRTRTVKTVIGNHSFAV